MVTMQCSKPALMQMFPVYLVTFEFSRPRCVGRPLCATGIKRCVSNDVKCVLHLTTELSAVYSYIDRREKTAGKKTYPLRLLES